MSTTARIGCFELCAPRLARVVRSRLVSLWIALIVRLELRNFRRFDRHTVPLHPTTLIVGPNNAGKSTIVEALRLVAIVASRYRALRFRDPPEWLEEEDVGAGVAPSLEGTGIDLSAVTHQYGDPPAEIGATFGERQEIRVYLGPEGQLHATLRDSDRSAHTHSATSTSPRATQRCDTASSRPGDERRATTRAGDGSAQPVVDTRAEPFQKPALAVPRILRRLLRDRRGNLAWVRNNRSDPRRRCGDSQPQLRLLVRNGPFVGELAAMGHGLQMWLQTIWFIVRTAGTDTVILDEPDVHTDQTCSTV